MFSSLTDAALQAKTDALLKRNQDRYVALENSSEEVKHEVGLNPFVQTDQENIDQLLALTYAIIAEFQEKFAKQRGELKAEAAQHFAKWFLEVVSRIQLEAAELVAMMIYYERYLKTITNPINYRKALLLLMQALVMASNYLSPCPVSLPGVMRLSQLYDDKSRPLSQKDLANIRKGQTEFCNALGLDFSIPPAEYQQYLNRFAHSMKIYTELCLAKKDPYAKQRKRLVELYAEHQKDEQALQELLSQEAEKFFSSKDPIMPSPSENTVSDDDLTLSLSPDSLQRLRFT